MSMTVLIIIGDEGPTNQVHHLRNPAFDSPNRLVLGRLPSKEELIKLQPAKIAFFVANFCALSGEAYKVYKECVDSGLNCIFIQNVLDIPWHLFDDVNVQKSFGYLFKILKNPDVVCTTISHVVRKHLQVFGIHSYVIDWPIKPVKYMRDDPSFVPFTINGVRPRVLLVGRVNDPNKNPGLCAKVIGILKENFGISYQEICVVGSEPYSLRIKDEYFALPYVGVVSDEILCQIYNTADILLSLSCIEGLCMPPIEATICGCIPVISNNLQTLYEVWSDHPFFSLYASTPPFAVPVAFLAAFFLESRFDYKKAEYIDKLKAFALNASLKYSAASVRKNIEKIAFSESELHK